MAKQNVINSTDEIWARTTGSGAFEDPVRLTSALPGSGSNFFPSVQADSEGGFQALWYSDTPAYSGLAADGDVAHAYLRPFDTNSIRIAPLTLEGLMDTGGEAGGLPPALTTDGAGNWIYCWGSNDSLQSTIGEDSDILYFRNRICP